MCTQSGPIIILDCVTNKFPRKLVHASAHWDSILLELEFREFREIMASAVFDEKWQQAKSTIKERGIFVFNNELLSDVSLVVRSSTDESGSKKSKMSIPAHKMVLSICSRVFFAMFCGKMAEKSDSVDLPDCEYEGVLEMLRYMYSGKAELKESNVMQVLYVAKKYILPSLAQECVEFIQENLNAANVFSVISPAQKYDEDFLVDQCWEVIDRETEEAVKSDGFVTVERSLLEEIVKRDSLTINEVELFKAVDCWATKECERQGLATDGPVKRRVLGEEIVKEIRFPTMDEKEFASLVICCNILRSEEVIDIVKCFNSVESSEVNFSAKRRVGSYVSCCRFTLLADDLYFYSSDANLERECTDLSVDRDILLCGVRMFGSEDNEYVVILWVIDRQDDFVVASKSGKFLSVPIHVKSQSTDCKYYGFDVLFDSPVVLHKNVKYCIKAMMDGPGSRYGIGCHHSVKSHGVTFQFSKNVQESSTGTDADSGQFAEFLFRPK